MDIRILTSEVRVDCENIQFSLGLNNTSDSNKTINKVVGEVYKSNLKLIDELISVNNYIMESYKKDPYYRDKLTPLEARGETYNKIKTNIKNKIEILNLL